MFVSFLVVAFSFFGSSCDVAASDLYNAEKQFAEVRYCSCMNRSDFKAFKSKTEKQISKAASCFDLEPRYDSLRVGLGKYLSGLK